MHARACIGPRGSIKTVKDTHPTLRQRERENMFSIAGHHRNSRTQHLRKKASLCFVCLRRKGVSTEIRKNSWREREIRKNSWGEREREGRH